MRFREIIKEDVTVTDVSVPGYTIFNVYDPETGKSTNFSSEQEALAFKGQAKQQQKAKPKTAIVDPLVKGFAAGRAAVHKGLSFDKRKDVKLADIKRTIDAAAQNKEFELENLRSLIRQIANKNIKLDLQIYPDKKAEKQLTDSAYKVLTKKHSQEDIDRLVQFAKTIRN